MPNRLANEASPYLLQHAENPVAWEPWGEEAFARARRENKPIFLSIGYATCHWCHVMAHESFENPEIGELLNRDFVSIKVDREERPDVDKIYMTYVQSMTGRGGWPLNVFLTPDLKPFFGGTYYPTEDRQGHPGFRTVLNALAHTWHHDRSQLLGEGERVVQALQEHFEQATGSASPRPEAAGWLEQAWPAAYGYFNESFDADRGGFGGAPKFPQPGNLLFLLRYAAGTDDAAERAEALRMVTQTLGRMSCGGIHDHVGGGFHRYSVDEAWFIPHFEKMLYDQAQLCSAALATWQAVHDERFAWIARDILGYALRDLRHPGGAFFSAEDADSPVSDGSGHGQREGAFYVWEDAELRTLLGADHALVAAHFGVTAEGNVPARLDPHGDFTGRNHLAQQRPLSETASRLGMPVQEAGRRLAAALELLRETRARRQRPLRDEKIVCAWNGLMISALARAAACPSAAFREGWPSHGGIPGNQVCLEAATAAADWILTQLRRGPESGLLRSWCAGTDGPAAVAEDYACLVRGLLDLHESTLEPRWLREAESLQDAMNARFLDAERGGFFDSDAGAPNLILRLKEDYDGAEPAPTSVAVSNLLRLSALLGRPELREVALRSLDAFRPHWEKFPQAMPAMLCALEQALLWPPQRLEVSGEPGSAEVRALLDVLWESPAPPRILVRGSGGNPAVTLCAAETCLPPATTPESLRELLCRV